jgi:Zn-dependent protease/CBS domain-containing protein
VFRNALTMGQIAGIRVSVHYSWLLVLLFVTWSLGGGFFPQEYRDWPPAVYWIAGGAASLLLLLSVLLHELGHSLVARARGVRVLGITLFLFGGVSTLEDEAASARDELLIAIAGPATSVALAAGCWALATALPGSGAPRATLSYAATLNLVLGAFNLLPGFPLDGGRVLRAAIWRLSGSQSRGTRVASYAGQGVGLLLVLWGLFQALNGGLLSGLWSALIGWFLHGAAVQARRAQALRERLAAVPVQALMRRSPEAVPAAMSLEELVHRYALYQGRAALPVVEDGRLVGLVGVSDAAGVPRAAWGATTVAQVMTRPPLPAVAPRDGLDAALAILTRENVPHLPVVNGAGELVGILSRSDVWRYLRHGPGSPPGGPPDGAPSGGPSGGALDSQGVGGVAGASGPAGEGGRPGLDGAGLGEGDRDGISVLRMTQPAQRLGHRLRALLQAVGQGLPPLLRLVSVVHADDGALGRRGSH